METRVCSTHSDTRIYAVFIVERVYTVIVAAVGAFRDPPRDSNL